MGTTRLAALLAAAGLAVAVAGDVPAPAPEAIAGYVGAARCAECHRLLHQRWRGGRHSRMLQPAGPASVRGDFTRPRLTLRGLEYGLRREGDVYFIREAYLEGVPRERRVDFTLGSRRVQHYLTTLPDGRIVVLPPSWDVERGRWFHNLEIVDPEETAETRVQVWNANCVGCHVSPQERGYDARSATYATRWTDFGTGCERCHGPGADHAAQHAAGKEAPAALVRPSALGPERESMVCAQCHSLRDVTAGGFAAGADYYDHFLPILEYAQKRDGDPAYWADGSPRRFSNDALGLWQSPCHLRGGATCTTCHLDPHQPDIDLNPQLAPGHNALCLGCHQAVGARLEAHTHHRPRSAGSSCVECHMPYTVVSLKAHMRDHTIGVPAPQLTRRFGIPNACTECHRGRDAAWAERALQAWGGGARARRRMARA
ncbi:MAG TPA: ammonia-forming cytochrome c nitrite reductase subunit c552, partial [Vicinamibacteria bacterium]